MNDISTKEKILSHAHKLFAEKGFNGVSVREISKAADVNLAAINYHFENKENLYKETVSQCITEMAMDLRELYDQNKPISTEEFSILIFNHFNEHSEDLKTAFKMYVIDSEVVPESAEADDEMIGPPGGAVLYECIKAEKPQATHDDLIFAVRTIFTMVIHKSLICNSKCIMERGKLHKAEINDFMEMIKRISRLVLSDI
jgi:AcrR family transcriptional regulator